MNDLSACAKRQQQRDFGDEARWNALGEQWYRWADAANLWVTAWCVDEHQLWGGFWLSVYVSVGDGTTRWFYEATRSDGAHELLTVLLPG